MTSTTDGSAPEQVAFGDLQGLEGRTLGPGNPVTITQQQIDQFAEASLDDQWIHTDPARAAAGPFGTTIAHGYLTLSLASRLLFDLLEVTGASSVVNYGLDKVRFPAPVPVGSALRMTVTFTTVTAVAGGYQVAYEGAIRADGQDKPSCVLQGLFRYYGPEAS
ncbi:MAG: MaoC family dehydratase [Actinomycetales bacterium]|nr:MaoC family dehydratase [Actinomycetales bacterium]